MKIQGEKSEQMADSPLDYTERVDPDLAANTESATLDGVRCKVVTLPGEGNEGTTKMWIREDYGIPVRIETSLPEGGNMVMEYKNVKIEPLPAETFQLPAGVEIMDLGDMMKGLQVPDGQ
jgi:outer membrane lipoprotein-sorting protein